MSAPFQTGARQMDLGFERRGEHTVLARRLFAWPFVITRTFHLDARPAHLLTVIQQTSSGAMHGDDHLRQRFTLGPGAAVHLASQGAAAVHRAHPGDLTRDHVEMRLGPDSYFEYLPEPRILFPGAALEQRIDIDCAETAVALVADGFGVHDPAGGVSAFRQLESTNSLRFEGGEPVLIDRQRVEGPLPRCAGQFAAFGSLLFIRRQPAHALEAVAAQLTAALAQDGLLYGAASPLPADAGIGIRIAASNISGLRRGTSLVRTCLRLMLFAAAPVERHRLATRD